MSAELPNIHFISASAGSGKTHRITELIVQRLVNGECQPRGLIATTFTVRAAQELRERVAQKLHQSGHSTLADRLEESLVGTVHGICGRFLERFAFEVGISPRVEILAEEDAVVLLGEAIEMAVDGHRLIQLQRLADRLGQRNHRDHRYFWKRQVREVLNTVRDNDLRPEDLPSMAERSVAELSRFLPISTPDDLDARLGAAIGQALDRISKNGDDTKTTAEYSELLRDKLRALESNRLSWGDWIRLGKHKPGTKSRREAESIVEEVRRVECHPRLREDIRDYTFLIYDLARFSLVEFQRLKEERGLLDFSDLEQRAYRLARDRSDVLDPIDLLIVDEFQDTSPLQLALFMRLAALAREAVWVGDVKQAIYGFRQSDPELIHHVVDRVGSTGKPIERLSVSWRSTPVLVRLTNALFVPAFAEALGLSAGEVQLEARRRSTSSTTPALEFFELASARYNKGDGALKKLTADERAITLADGIVRLFRREPPVLIREKGGAERMRPVEHRDVAILCRTNAAAALVTARLAERGLAVTFSQAGLMATPEIRLALACLRRLADPTDSLAASEIVSLSGDQPIDDWLAHRLRYVARAREGTERISHDQWGLDGDFVHPGLRALESARAKLNVCSPREALDVALLEANVLPTVSAWGPTGTRAGLRRANLESLRGIAVKFEQASTKNHVSATVAGFLAWCESLAEAELDLKATDVRANAITVSTYHQAKGLEWPVVICADLETEPRPRLWEVGVYPVEPERPFDLGRPLANRWIRFWPWPFGSQHSGISILEQIRADAVGQRAMRQAKGEDLRLLYVGLTRARDLLVMVIEKDQPATWLDGLGAGWLRPGAVVSTPDGNRIDARTTQLTPPAESECSDPQPTYAWFTDGIECMGRSPARLNPSRQKQSAVALGRIVEIGPRLPFTGSPNETDLGDALHAVLAAEILNQAHPSRMATIERILGGYGLSALIRVEEVIAMVDRFLAVVEKRFDPKRILVEVPVASINSVGQRIEGVVDLLLETSEGWILIDHKAFPGRRSDWCTEASSYSGQLALYGEALRNLDLPLVQCWIHFAVGGGLVELNVESMGQV